MLSKMNGFEAIYLYAGKSDLRKGIDGLAALVKEQFNLNPFQKNVLFLFLRDQIRPIQRAGLGRRWVLPCLQAHRSRPSPMAPQSTGSCAAQPG